MTVLVDAAVWPHRGGRWAHLVSDASYDELHVFAAGLGIAPQAFQGDHYDVPETLRRTAIDAGAVPVTGRELVSRLDAAGLRARRESRQRPRHHSVPRRRSRR